jgi:hypothetical protein
MGTRLDRLFLSHQLNQVKIAVLNAFVLFWSLFSNISLIVPVLLRPLMKSMNRDVIYHSMKSIPRSNRATRCTYLAFAWPIGNFLGVLTILVALILLIAAAVVLPVIAVAILAPWALIVIVLFLFWVGLYRYPVFEMVYPRIRRKMLINNSHVYSKLSEDAACIRVIRLKAGSAADEIECDLLSGPLSGIKFDALSYVWGVTLLPHTIRVNGKPFYVTYNLYTALQELRCSDRERLLWIDAMCINQYDNTEKGSQVQMMRDIYAKASTVVVWLGASTRTTCSTFEFIRQFSVAELEKMDDLWKDHVMQPTWRAIRREFVRIFDYEWWNRAWIIQEIVVGRTVVMQRGPHQIQWEAFHKLLTYRPFGNDEFGAFEPPLFAKNIQSLRVDEDAAEPSSTTLGELVSRFRFQSATFGSDKIYALLGLLKSGNSSLIKPDYNKTPEEVFVDFTVSCLTHDMNLNILTLALGTEIQGVSWCRDWRLSYDGSLEAIGLATRECLARPFSASGSHTPVFKVDLKEHILSLQGYRIDTVAKIGDFHQRTGSQPVDWDIAFRSWELVAGDISSNEQGSESRAAFERTVTADRPLVGPLEWKRRILPRRKLPRNDEDKEYRAVVEEACINRRFFVTKEGGFGLGPWNLKKGDTVCILLGGRTPFVLRRRHDRASRKKHADENIDSTPFYKLIGEAYVDGLMYYERSVDEDIASGKILTDWFHLL